MRTRPGAMAIGLMLCLCAAPSTRAEEPAARRSTDSVTVITRQEIERRQWRTLADVLRAQTGIHLTQLGGRGQDTLLFFRGNPSGTVLLRMDGIDLSDPSSSPLGTLDDPQARAAGQIVPDLLTENIERITILRGPQSARYGSDAIGGVIEVESRRGEGKLAPWAFFEAGGFGTTQQSVGLAGGGERGGYAFAYSNAHTRGISATPARLGSHERDADDNDTLSGRLDFAPTDALALRLSGRMIDEDTQLDNGFAIPLALGFDLDPRSVASASDRRGLEGERRRLYLGAETSLALLDERWVQTLGIRYGDHDVRQDESQRTSFSSLFPVGAPIPRAGPGPTLEDFSIASRDGTRLGLDWRSEVRLGDAHTLTLGAETEREATRSVRFQRTDTAFLSFGLLGGITPVVFRTQRRDRAHESLRNNALFVADRFAYGDVLGELALRLHDHDEYGSGLTYRAALSYVEPRSKLRVFASIATAFRDPDPALAADTILRFEDVFGEIIGANVRIGPSVTELVIPGDRTLDRAVSRGVEVGVEAPLLDDRLQLSATLFASRVRGLQSASSVFFDSQGRVTRVLGFDDSADERARGAELSAAWEVDTWLGVALDYTYTHAELAHVRPGLSPIPIDDGGLIIAAPSARAFAATPPFQFFFARDLASSSGSDLPGVPRHELHGRVELRPQDGVTLGLGLRYVGPRKGSALGGGDRLGGYTLFDVTGSYAIAARVTLFARIENLFDKEYTDLELGGQPGVAGFVGLRAAF